MGYTNCRVSGIDPLASGAGSMVHIDAHITRIYVYFDLGRKNGKNFNSCKARLTTLFIVRGGNANKTMDALFGAKHSVCVFSRYRKRCMINADDLGRSCLSNIHAPTSTGRIAQIHMKEHVRPVLRLKTTLPGLDRHDGIAVIKLIGKPA